MNSHPPEPPTSNSPTAPNSVVCSDWLALARSSQPGQRFKFTHSQGWSGVVILERVTEDAAIFCGFVSGVKDPHQMRADLDRFKELTAFEKL